ncbi:MAG: 2-C-methyl-D-erythritol 4-phosphate cytidylyltransferase [Rhodoglobus sp.]
MSDVAVIVVAAGSGTRLGLGKPKAFAEIGGVTILHRALRTVRQWDATAQVIVVAPHSHLDVARAIAQDGTTIVPGGATRQDSVAAGLVALEPSVRLVLVHDAARALTTVAQFERVVRAVRQTGAGVIPSLPVRDTLKRVAAGTVIETLDREPLVHVQTPQGFPRTELVEAYEKASTEFTDDAALFAASGHVVTTVPGEELAFKITTPADLARAEQELRGSEMNLRTGIGIDVHAYDAAEPLWLGGLYWPDEVGLSGHSDGDAVCHAICDALLSAAGLGDIGSRFGTDDPRFEGAHGEVFIAETLAMVEGAGYIVGNVAVQIVAKHPRLGDRRGELEAHLSRLVNAPVSVAATTSDGLGFTGRAEGVAAVATALLEMRPV